MSNHGIFSYCILITCILKTFAFCSLKRREMYQMFQDNLTLKGGYFGNSFLNLYLTVPGNEDWKLDINKNNPSAKSLMK